MPRPGSRILLLTLWLGCFFLPAGSAADLAFLRRTVDLQPDGSAAIRMEVVPGPGQDGAAILLPLGYADIAGLSVASPDRALGSSSSPVTDLGGNPILALQLGNPAANLSGGPDINPVPAAHATMTVSFTVPGLFAPGKAAKSPWGNLSLSVAWQNIAPNRIASAEMVVLLPPGFVVNTIDDSSPAPGREDPSLPYAFDRVDGRDRLVIRLSGMKTGDRLMLQFRMKPKGRSTGFLIAVLLAALAWLFFFRDLVAAPSPKPAEAEPPHP